MLLLSLRARIFLLRDNKNQNSSQIFGFYLKLTPGVLCNLGTSSDFDLNTSLASIPNNVQIDLAVQEIIIQLIESLFSELVYCLNQKLIHCESNQLEDLTKAANALLFYSQPKQISSLEELLENFACNHMQIAAYIRRRFIYNEQAKVPVANFDLTQLKNVIKIVRKFIPSLHNSRFMALLDEYENLLPIQQRIVNDLVKLGPPEFSVKIAKKLGSRDTSGTTIGQEIQETHDYTRVALVYDVEDKYQLQAYHNLLRNIVQNILISESLDKVDVHELLPKDDSPEVQEQKLKSEILNLSKVTNDKFNEWSDEIRSKKWLYYKEAATYRVLFGGKGRHAEKRFSGFEQLAFVSSGVIRYFLEILSVAYYLTYSSELCNLKRLTFPHDKQSKAVHLVSQHNLTTLSRSVERHGETLKYFLLDLGSCLKHKLLKHTSEPEAARLTIDDPEILENKEMDILKRLLSIGEREGVFQTKEGLPAFKPKHTSDPQPSEFNICRIYTPVLEISPRLRWRTNVKCSSLLGLLLPGKRSESIKRLKKLMVKPMMENYQRAIDFPEEGDL
jgi:hypothetical protein